MSDQRKFVAGTFVWSGFSYLGESRGWPQNTKCRGTVADVAGFTKETSYLFRSWWLSSIPHSDPGRPVNVVGDKNWTIFIVESWTPPARGIYRSVHVYTNAPTVRLLLNGVEIEGAVKIAEWGMAEFKAVRYQPGNLTAVGIQDESVVATHTILSAGEPKRIVLSVDVPSRNTGTGEVLVLDGEDVAMLRSTLVDEAGTPVTTARNNVTFSVISGPGRIWATHNGNPANLHPSHAPWTPSYGGLARAIVRVTEDSASSAKQRRQMRKIDAERWPNIHVADPDGNIEHFKEIIIRVDAELDSGLVATDTVKIPVSVDMEQSPLSIFR